MSPRKKSTKKTPAPKGFNLLEDDSFAERTKENVLRLKSKTPSSLSGLSNLKSEMLCLDPLYLQYIISNFGLQYHSILDVIGMEGIGKTSLLFTIFGWAMSQNSPCLYIETESKPMDEKRIKRCLHTNPKIADKMYDRITAAQCYEITQAVDTMEQWVNVMRDKSNDSYVPHHIPLLIGLDTFSKLMAPDEAAGVMKYVDNSTAGVEKEKKGSKKAAAAKVKVKGLEGGSNFGHAKTAQRWSRRLPNWLRANNIILILNRHQNDKVDMSGFGGVSLNSESAAGYNTTSIGGRAFKQNAALQLVLSRFKFATASIGGQNVKIGVDVKITVSKNSYGPEGRVGYYRITNSDHKDTEDYQEPAVSFAPYTAEWLMAEKPFHVTSKNKNCFTIPELGIVDGTQDEVYAALQSNEEIKQAIGSRLNIRGYAGGVKQIHPVVSAGETGKEEEPSTDEDVPAESED